MTLKTYQATTMAEALAQVKRDLGRNAVILHTRNFRKGGLMGLIGGRSVWEVTASPNVNVPSRPVREPHAAGIDLDDGDYTPRREMLSERSVLTATAGLSDDEFQDIGIEEIDAELANLLGPADESPAAKRLIASITGFSIRSEYTRTATPEWSVRRSQPSS